MTDPRQNLPSASSFPRYATCPGSFHMEQLVPPEPSSEEAESGTRIHQRLAHDINVSLSAEEEELAEECRRLGEEAIVSVLGGPPDDLQYEERLWLRNPEDLSKLCSGQFDLLARRGKKVIILDYKTGRLEVRPEDSWQLRCLVALATENGLVSDEDNLTVAIVQPWLAPRVRYTLYQPEDRMLAMEAAHALAERVLTPGQPRVPSEAACMYCRAKPICPDAHKVITDTASLVLPDGRNGEVLDGTTAAWLLDRCGLAERVIGSIRARAKAMLAENPESIPGWKLKEGAMREKIVDVAGVWTRTAPLGVDAGQFAKACSLAKTNLKAMLRETLGVRGKALDEQVVALTEGCVEAKRAAPQLMRTGASDGKLEEGNGDE